MNYTNIQVKILKDLEKAEKDKEKGLHQFRPWTIGQVDNNYIVFGRDIVEVIPMYHFFLQPLAISGGLLPESGCRKQFQRKGLPMSRAYKYHDESGEKVHVFVADKRHLIHIMSKQLFDFDTNCRKHETTMTYDDDGWCTVSEDGVPVGRVKPIKVE